MRIRRSSARSKSARRSCSPPSSSTIASRVHRRPVLDRHRAAARSRDPRGGAAAVAASCSPRPGRPRMVRATVLLADDHTVLLEALAILLQKEFSLVGTVTDGRLLIEAAARLRPDVIVTDVAMPGMSGLEADRKSTRLNSSHLGISYAVFCLKKKNEQQNEW